MTVYGNLALQGKQWVMSGIPPHVAIRLKSTFPKVAKEETTAFHFAHTPEVCSDLEWFTYRYPMAMTDDDRSLLKHGKGLFERQREEIEGILLPTWQPPMLSGFKPGFAPYHGQAQAAELTNRLGRLLLMDDVGLGKTVSALATVVGSKNMPAAVSVPSHLPRQWQKEFIEKFTNLRAHQIRKGRPYSLPRADIYLFKEGQLSGWVDIAATGMFKTFVMDEAQGFRHGVSTAKGRAAKVFAEKAAVRMALTATPVYNYGSEIFNIVELIAPGALGTWEEFVREWCTGRSGKWVVKEPDALGTYLREAQLVLRRLRDGRPINTLVLEVEHDEEVERQSLDLARTLAMRVVSGSFTERGQAARDLDALARQVTGVSKARSVAAYVRILIKAGVPVILAGWHREVYSIWLKELAEFNPVMFTGSESPLQKEMAKQAFIRGDANPFIISLRSGIGLDGLQKRGWTVVFGELDWSPKVDEQIIGRVDRPGQMKDEIDAIYLVTNSGSDQTIMDVRGLKASQARGIVDPLRGVEQVYSDDSRIKKLAEQYLKGAA